MKKKIIVLGACMLLVAGCGKTIPKLKDGSEAVVTFKKGNISANELYNEVKDTYGLSTLITMIDKQILEKEYKDDLEDAKSSAKNQIEQIKSQYGDNALSAVQQFTGFSTMEAYEDYLYIAYLQNLAVEDYAKDQIKDSDIEKYYNESIYGDIKVSHILITPEVKDDMSEDEKTKAEEKAKKEAEKLIKKLDEAEDASKEFKTLAKKNSDDAATSENGGDLGYINTDTLSSDYEGFADEAYKLNDGEYTKEPVKTSLGYHIILRVKSKEKAKLEDVKDKIIDTLSNELISNDATTSINALQDIRKKYGMEIKDSELSKQYSNYIQNSLSKAIEQNSSSTEQ